MKLEISEQNKSKLLYMGGQVAIITYTLECNEEETLNFINSKDSDINEDDFRHICELLEWDSLAIFKSNEKTLIGSSVGAGLTYIAPYKDKYSISKTEKKLISHINSYDTKIAQSTLLVENRTLYSLSAFQEKENYGYILCPGMINTYKGSDCIFEEWHLNPDKFCESTYCNQEKELFCSNLLSSLNQILESKMEIPITLMLSSGIDSSIIAAATKNLEKNKRDKITCVNFRPNPYIHEAIQSEYLAKNLGLNFCGVPEYGLTSVMSNGCNNLDDSVNRWNCLKGRTHMAQSIVNMDQAATVFFGYHTSIGGTTGPTNLQIFHHLDYNQFSKLHQSNYLQNKEQLVAMRDSFRCKIVYKLKMDNHDLETKSNDILGVYSYLSSRVNNIRYIYPKRNGEDHLAIKYDPLRESNLEFILEKIKSSNFIKRLNKKTHQEDTAQKILKLFTYMLHSTRTLTAFRNYSFADQKSSCEPLLSSKIIKQFLGIRIDNQLVESPKCILFDAFESFSGYSYESHYQESETYKDLAAKSAELKTIDRFLERRHPFLKTDLPNFILKEYNEEIGSAMKRGLLNAEQFKSSVRSKGGLELNRYLDKVISTIAVL